MAHMLAMLGPTLDARRRVIHARGEDQLVEVSGAAAAQDVGLVVLLSGEGPPWSHSIPVRCGPWPQDLATARQLWQDKTGQESHPVRAALASYGTYVLDDRQKPCEIGRGRTGGPVDVVLNYAGWRLADFSMSPVEIIVTRSPAGVTWIIPPASVPAPAEDEPEMDHEPWGVGRSVPGPPPLPRPEPLPSIPKQRRRFVEAALASPRWVDAEELAARRPGAGGGRDPGDLLEVPEFGMDKRAQAFRLLFAHREKSVPLHVLPGRAVVVPLPAADGGPRWYAWETVLDNRATYLFRPACEEQLRELLAWTAAPGVRRYDLLSSPALQERLGFVGRVLHTDEREEQLAPWWRRLCEVVGLSAEG